MPEPADSSTKQLQNLERQKTKNAPNLQTPDSAISENPAVPFSLQISDSASCMPQKYKQISPHEAIAFP